MMMARVLHLRLIVLVARFDILVDATDSPEGVDCGFGELMVSNQLVVVIGSCCWDLG